MQCQGSGAGDSSDLAGRAAGIGEAGPQEDRRLGGLGTDELGQRQETRLSENEGRADRSAQCVVHVDLGSNEVQPVDPDTVSRIVEAGEGQEGGADGMHAEVPDHLERNDARSGPVQANGDCLRRTGFPFNRVFALDFQDSCCTLC